MNQMKQQPNKGGKMSKKVSQDNRKSKGEEQMQSSDSNFRPNKFGINSNKTAEGFA